METLREPKQNEIIMFERKSPENDEIEQLYRMPDTIEQRAGKRRLRQADRRK